MLCQLAAEELAYLTGNFRILEESGDEVKVSLSQLKDPEFLQGFLESLKVELGTDSTLAAASQFMKRVGYLAVVPPLYAAAVFGKALHVNFDTCFLVPRRQGNLWMPWMILEDLSAVELAGRTRNSRFEAFVRRLFSDLTEVIQAVSVTASVPKSILWENVAVYVYWLYENRLMEECDNSVRLQGWRDFEVILEDLPASVFGSRANPLRRFYKEKTVDLEYGEAIRVRQTCCFSYRTAGNKGYCKNCPKNR